MAEQPKSPPITPDQALQELSNAGSVAGLAQQAMLDHLGRVAGAKAVRLKREVLRLGKKLGKDAPETQAEAGRSDAHALFVAAIKVEQERSAVPTPPLDPKAAIVYGRILGSEGPAAGLTVEAYAIADQKSLGRTTTDAKGSYQLSLPISASTALHLQVRGGAQQTTLADSGILTLQPGTRAFREIVLSAQPTPPPQPGGGPSPGGTDEPIMPNLVGMTEARALEVLRSLGIVSVTAERRVAEEPVGQVIGQVPAPNQPVKDGTSVTLTISAGPAVAVPNLRGMSGAEAAVALNRVGLTLGSITGDRPTGRVTSQKPAAGEKVMAGSAVDLVFGEG
jgi:PASTA domain